VSGSDPERRPPAAPAFRCAAAALVRDDPQLGSAPQARRWLLIEHPGPWQIDALGGSRIAPAVLELLIQTAQAQGARPLLIRRPGRGGGAGERSWAVVYENRAVIWGTWRHDDELRAAAQALAANAPAGGAAGAPILLVCAHGLHDVCCALRGRPVAAALAEEWPEQTWECSHVGGDRFAANLVVLPDGVYYGQLEPESARDTVRSHLGGAVPVRYLRGMTRVPPPAQVAIAAVHQRFGPFGANDVQVSDVRRTAPGVWQVHLGTPQPSGRDLVVVVGSTRRSSAQLTCRAASETPATEYHVVELHATNSP
jgi:hypothetical protein